MPGFIFGNVECNLSGSIVTEPNFSSRMRCLCSGVTVPGRRKTQSSDASIGIVVGFCGTAVQIVKARYHARKSKARPRAIMTKTPQPSWYRSGILSGDGKYGLMGAPPEVG